MSKAPLDVTLIVSKVDTQFGASNTATEREAHDTEANRQLTASTSSERANTEDDMAVSLHNGGSFQSVRLPFNLIVYLLLLTFYALVSITSKACSTVVLASFLSCC